MLWDDYDDDVTDVHDGREPYTGQVGGRVSATQWPLRSNMALDVYFDGKGRSRSTSSPRAATTDCGASRSCAAWCSI